MTRIAPHTALAAALLATLALAGCKKQEPEAAMPPAAATAAAPMPTESAPPPPMPATVPAPATTAAPAATAMTITSVDLGTAIGSDNRVAAPMTEFIKTDTIHASVATDGSAAGTLGARWTFQDGQVVHTEDKSVAAGPQITEFSVSKPDGWPAGKYKLEVLRDGKPVQTREFSVKPSP
jgi:hypothetical protein